MDFNFPDQEKSLAKIAFLTNNVDSDSTVKLSYKTDDSTYDDDQGWTDIGTLTSSGHQVLTPSLTTPVSFKRIRLRQASDSQVLSTTLSNLDTLRQQAFILYTDIDGTQYRARISNRTLIPIDRDRRFISGAATERSYLLSLTLNEVKTS